MRFILDVIFKHIILDVIFKRIILDVIFKHIILDVIFKHIIVDVMSLNPADPSKRKHSKIFRVKIIAPETRHVKNTQKKEMYGET